VFSNLRNFCSATPETAEGLHQKSGWLRILV
jgi:hypothetical protein